MAHRMMEIYLLEQGHIMSKQVAASIILAGAIDRSSSVPFHFQLRKLLEREIEAGHWRQGDRLPSESFLSDHYGVRAERCEKRSTHSSKKG